MTRAASRGSMPPRSASSSPSLKASVWTARLMLIASLSSSPWPLLADAGHALAELAQQRLDAPRRPLGSPPTMIVSVPVSAWGTLPETGASSIWAPIDRTRSATVDAGLGADGAHVDVDLPGRQPGEDAVRPGGDRLKRRIVADHAEHDVGGVGDFPRRGVPAQAAVDQRLRLGDGAVGGVHLMAGGEQAASDPAAHRPEADESDRCSSVGLLRSRSTSSALELDAAPRRGSGRPGRAGGSRRSRHRRPGCAASRRPRPPPAWCRGARATAARRCTCARCRESSGSWKRASCLRQSSSGRFSIRSRVMPPRQQTRAHRRVDDHADPLALGERQDLVLDLARDQRVRRLQSLHRRDLLDPAQLLDVEVRHADVAHQPLLLQLGQRRPALLDVRPRGRASGSGRGRSRRPPAAPGWPRPRAAASRAQVVHDPPPGALEQRALGEHVRAARPRPPARGRPSRSERPKP